MCMQCRRPRFDPWVGKMPWRRKWQPIPVFLPGEFREHRSLEGYSPWGCKESDMTEQTHTHTHLLQFESLPPGFHLLLASLKCPRDISKGRQLSLLEVPSGSKPPLITVTMCLSAHIVLASFSSQAHSVFYCASCNPL